MQSQRTSSGLFECTDMRLLSSHFRFFLGKKTYRAGFFREASKCNKVLPVKSPKKYMGWQMRKMQNSKWRPKFRRNSLYLFVFIEIRI